MLKRLAAPARSATLTCAEFQALSERLLLVGLREQELAEQEALARAARQGEIVPLPRRRGTEQARGGTAQYCLVRVATAGPLRGRPRPKDCTLGRANGN